MIDDGHVLTNCSPTARPCEIHLTPPPPSSILIDPKWFSPCLFIYWNYWNQNFFSAAFLPVLPRESLCSMMFVTDVKLGSAHCRISMFLINMQVMMTELVKCYITWQWRGQRSQTTFSLRLHWCENVLSCIAKWYAVLNSIMTQCWWMTIIYLLESSGT